MALQFDWLGPEIQANTAASGAQAFGKIAALTGGGFVVTWQDTVSSAGGATGAIKAQRFDALGNKVGGEFLVNTTPTATHSAPTVAALQGGGFAIAWTDVSGQGGDPNSSVKGQIYDASGATVGSEFLVNTATANAQGSSTIGAFASGGFIVAWTDSSGVGGDASSSGIKAQFFDSTGGKVGGEILVNTTTIGAQNRAEVAVLSNGGFAVTWFSAPGNYMVQLFDSAGAKVGVEESLTSTNSGGISAPRITALGAGYVVAWNEYDSSDLTPNFDIRAQRFDASGSKIGPVFTINGETDGDQAASGLASLPGGGFLATWDGPDSAGSGTDIRAQAFDASGQKSGVEFIVHAATAGYQSFSRAAVLTSGDVAVTWNDTSGGSPEVKLQLLTASITPASDIALSASTVSETAIENLAVATLSASGGALNASYSYAIVSDSTGGAFGIDGGRLIVVDNARLDFETAPTAEVRVRATDGNGLAFEETLTLTIADAAIEARRSAGDVFSAQGVDELYDTVSSVTPLASGGFLVARYVIDSGLALGSRGQIFDPDGQAVGSDFRFDLPLAGNYEFPIAALASGGFVAAFWAAADGGVTTPVKVQRFDAAGNEVGGEIILDGGQGGFPEPALASFAGGGFIVTWLKYTQPASGPPTADIYGQLFDAAGATVGGEFVVNANPGEARGAKVMELPGGGFVVVWREYDPPGVDDGGSIRGQFFTSAGIKVGGEFTVLADDTGVYGGPELTVLGNGMVVVGWLEEIDPAADIYSNGFQIVGADGTNLGGPVPVAVFGAGYTEQTLTATPDGGFVVTWSGINPAGGNADDTLSWARFFDASGAPVGDTFVIEDTPDGFENMAQVGVLSSGDLVFAWSRLFQRDSDGASTSDAYARIVRPADAGATPGDDRFDLDQPGDANVAGLGGNDGFYFGAEFTAADRVDGGDGSNDQIGLEGNYTGDNRLVLGEDTITGVEVIALLPGGAYDITTVDANVPNGGRLTIFGGNLGPGDFFIFNGSAEKDGSFKVYGGQGIDLITTGAGNDAIHFGPGKFNPANDRVDGGTGANDQLALDGHYALTLDGTAIRNIDVIELLKGAPGDLADYNLTLDASLLGVGQSITIWGTQVQTALTVNGSLETDGTSTIRVYGGTLGDALTGGAGNDWLWGGTGGDSLAGGAGADTFAYGKLSESTAAAADLIADFGTGDQIDLSLLDADLDTTGNQAFHLGATPGHAGDIVLAFDAGSNQTSVSLFADGDATADAVIFLSGNHLGLGAADFVL